MPASVPTAFRNSPRCSATRWYDAVVQWLRLQSDVWSTHTHPQGHDDAGPPPNWPEPQPLPEGLLPVAPFSTDFLPFTLSSWVDDIAERMQCPPEFIAVTAVAALGAVLGRRIGVRPQQHTDWVEVCSFWGCVVGRPGWLKSPAMAEALRPLMRLESRGTGEERAGAPCLRAGARTVESEEEGARECRPQ